MIQAQSVPVHCKVNNQIFRPSKHLAFLSFLYLLEKKFLPWNLSAPFIKYMEYTRVLLVIACCTCTHTESSPTINIWFPVVVNIFNSCFKRCRHYIILMKAKNINNNKKKVHSVPCLSYSYSSVLYPRRVTTNHWGSKVNLSFSMHLNNTSTQPHTWNTQTSETVKAPAAFIFIEQHIWVGSHLPLCHRGSTHAPTQILTPL